MGGIYAMLHDFVGVVSLLSLFLIRFKRGERIYFADKTMWQRYFCKIAAVSYRSNFHLISPLLLAIYDSPCSGKPLAVWSFFQYVVSEFVILHTDVLVMTDIFELLIFRKIF